MVPIRRASAAQVTTSSKRDSEITLLRRSYEALLAKKEYELEQLRLSYEAQYTRRKVPAEDGRAATEPSQGAARRQAPSVPLEAESAPHGQRRGTQQNDSVLLHVPQDMSARPQYSSGSVLLSSKEALDDLGPAFLQGLTQGRLDVISSAESHMRSLSDQGRHAEAAALGHRILQSVRLTLGEEHPSALEVAAHLITMLTDQGRFSEADRLQQQQLELMRRTRGAEHPETVAASTRLSTIVRLASRTRSGWRISRSPNAAARSRTMQLSPSASHLDGSIDLSMCSTATKMSIQT